MNDIDKTVELFKNSISNSLRSYIGANISKKTISQIKSACQEISSKLQNIAFAEVEECRKKTWKDCYPEVKDRIIAILSYYILYKLRIIKLSSDRQIFYHYLLPYKITYSIDYEKVNGQFRQGLCIVSDLLIYSAELEIPHNQIITKILLQPLKTLEKIDINIVL